MFKNLKPFILISALIFSAYPGFAAWAALSCSVSSSCSSPGVVVLRMSGTTNAHAELPGESNYSELLCCTGVTSLANSCSDDYAVVLRLSGTTNAHVEENTESTPAYDGNDACLSVPDGTVTIGYENNNCSGFDTILASISGTPTNAHIGEAAAYARKVCGTITTGTVTPPPPSPGGGGGGGRKNDTDIVNGCRIADFNCDGKVNLLDLSIFLYHADQPGPVQDLYDLNDDRKLDLLDISIMFYYWDL